MKTYNNLFEKIISPENLFAAWDTFKRGKRKKPDVMKFERNLESNIFELRRDLRNRTYRHGPYTSFYIYDPKRRHIHKAPVRDRVLHHAVFSVLNPVFEPTFIAHSFSCRKGKGTHKGMKVLHAMLRSVSKNEQKPCFALKCDIRKFFDSVDHEILRTQLKRVVKDKDTLWLLDKIIESFGLGLGNLFGRRGLPIGNLTSQLFANIYLGEFDHFVKHILNVRYYVRYTDDFVIVSENRAYLEQLIISVAEFLRERLALELHPSKVEIRKYRRGIDFLGYVLRPHHRAVRTKTLHRMFRRLQEYSKTYSAGQIERKKFRGAVISYLGVLFHANTYRLSEDLKNRYWFLLREN